METHDHFSVEILLDYLDHLTDALTTAQVRAHLEAGCGQCSAELARWARLIEHLAADRLPEPPEAALQHVLNLPNREKGASPSLPRARHPRSYDARESLGSRLVAHLLYDSRVQPALAGTRESAATFQLLFEVDGTDVDLFCKRGEDGWSITGQALTGNAPEAGWAIVAVGESESTGVETDGRGEFRFTGLAPGAYEFVLRGDDREIVLPNVRLTGSPC